jgi:hypothetical protein
MNTDSTDAIRLSPAAPARGRNRWKGEEIRFLSLPADGISGTVNRR